MGRLIYKYSIHAHDIKYTLPKGQYALKGGMLQLRCLLHGYTNSVNIYYLRIGSF